jgi:glycosyl transferase family 2
MTVSVIIPVRDDAKRLAMCLDAIRANARDVEIIVVDNGSSDESALVARAYGARVIERPGAAVAMLRNAGAQAASGDVLAFVDADHVIDANWIAAARSALSDFRVAAAGAPYSIPAGATWVQRAYNRFRVHRAGVVDVSWLGSGNLAVRRDVFLRVGAFDATLDTCEDVDFCNRVRAAGYRVVSDARLRSVHLGDPATLRALFLGELWRGRDNLRVTLRGPLALRDIPSVVIPVLNLCFLLSMFAAVVVAPWTAVDATAIAAAGLLAAALFRTARMARHSSAQDRLLNVPANFVVACVYELARALALVARATHRTRRELTMEPAP